MPSLDAKIMGGGNDGSWPSVCAKQRPGKEERERSHWTMPGRTSDPGQTDKSMTLLVRERSDIL